MSAAKELKTFQELTIMFEVFVVSSLKLFLGYRRAGISMCVGLFGLFQIAKQKPPVGHSLLYVSC